MSHLRSCETPTLGKVSLAEKGFHKVAMASAVSTDAETFKRIHPQEYYKRFLEQGVRQVYHPLSIRVIAMTSRALASIRPDERLLTGFRKTILTSGMLIRRSSRILM